MCIELFTNPTVIGTISGALIGAISSWVLATKTEQHKFDKQKNGAQTLIQSEINNITSNLKKFRDKYVNEEIKPDDSDKKIGELFNFYNQMSNFPKWNNRNWISLINFIPSIFEEEEINKINQFYAKCEELSDVANELSDKEFNFDSYLKGEIEASELTPLETVSIHRNMFRNDLNELIKLGEEIKEIFHY